jgi:hypothetical protein
VSATVSPCSIKLCKPAGNLADALNCSRLAGKQLKATCKQGYFFNSSHNIYIDRALGIGWLGALAYIAIIVLAIRKGLRVKPESKIFAYGALLIGLYYLTNVTSLTLELLFWILLMRCLIASRA